MDNIISNAKLNITFNGCNGDLPDPVNFDASDEELLRIASEAIQTGYVPGIPADLSASLVDFVVDRFAATSDLPNRCMIRAKTPFGK